MTETVPLRAPSTRPPVVRRLPVPVSEPPYDDELPLALRPIRRDAPSQRWSGNDATPSGPTPVQGALALSFALPGGAPAIPQAPPGLRLVRSAAGATGEGWAEPQPTSRADLPDPAGWAPRLAQALVEVVGGERPLAQLVRWTSAEVYDRLRRGLGWTRGRDRDHVRAVVRSVTVSEPADGVAEVAALVRRGQRCTALALRLEGLDGRWQCTALEIR